MRDYWPKQTDDATGISEYLNRVSKYVVSSTLEDPEWDHTTVLRGPLMEEIQALRSAPGADIVATGSITLVRDLIAAVSLRHRADAVSADLSEPLSSRTPTSRCRSAAAGRRARGRGSPQGAGRVATGTPVAPRGRSRHPVRRHVRP